MFATMSGNESHASRVAVFADTHGNGGPVREAVARFGPFDALLHLGDGVEDGRAAADEAGLPFVGVAGNEDRHVICDESALYEAGTMKMLLVHGHQVDINPYEEEAALEGRYRQLAYMARRAGARIVLFGHTHEPLVRVVQGIVLCNPGSMYRGSSSPATFAVVETGEVHINISLQARTPDGAWDTMVSFVNYNFGTEPAVRR